jgi:hypothetical protein
MTASARIHPDALPDDPDELRDTARAMAERLQRIDDAATAAAEPIVSVRWIKDGSGQVNDRAYSGKGPVYRRRMTPAGEVHQLEAEGELQQLPLGAAAVLQAAGYVEGITDEDSGHIYAAMTGAST